MGQYAGKCKTIKDCQPGVTSKASSTNSRGKQGILSATIDSEPLNPGASLIPATTTTMSGRPSGEPLGFNSSSIPVIKSTTDIKLSSSGSIPTPVTTLHADSGISGFSKILTSITSTDMPVSTSSDTSASTSEPPCYVQNQSPHMAGIVSQFCKCPYGSTTLFVPLPTPTPRQFIPASACLRYTVVPVSKHSPKQKTKLMNLKSRLV